MSAGRLKVEKDWERHLLYELAKEPTAFVTSPLTRLKATEYSQNPEKTCFRKEMRIL